MGCDIHVRAERRSETGEFISMHGDFGFHWRNYGVFGWLADVRNYSGLTPLSQPRGLPADLDATEDEMTDDLNLHSVSWLSLHELLSVDYDQIIEDRRCTGMNARGYMDGGMTCEPGKGEKMPLREFLGVNYFESLELLKAAGADRIVFAFDN